MHIVQRRSLRSIAASLGATAILAAGCGTPARPAGERGRPIPSATASATPASKPASHTGRRTSSPGYADPLDRYAYREAFGRCSMLGVATVAHAYGAIPADPASAATAYAEHSYPRTIRYRQAATQGCLDGFSARGT